MTAGSHQIMGGPVVVPVVAARRARDRAEAVAVVAVARGDGRADPGGAVARAGAAGPAHAVLDAEAAACGARAGDPSEGHGPGARAVDPVILARAAAMPLRAADDAAPEVDGGNSAEAIAAISARSGLKLL